MERTLLTNYKNSNANTANCRVPRKYSNTLHHWVDQQRKNFREGKIHQERLQRLNEIGMWLCLPHWINIVSCELYYWRCHPLTTFRAPSYNVNIDRIFVECMWITMEPALQSAHVFKKQYGHCRVPQKYAENPQLGEIVDGWHTRTNLIPVWSYPMPNLFILAATGERRWRSDGLLWRVS